MRRRLVSSCGKGERGDSSPRARTRLQLVFPCGNEATAQEEEEKKKKKKRRRSTSCRPSGDSDWESPARRRRLRCLSAVAARAALAPSSPAGSFLPPRGDRLPSLERIRAIRTMRTA
ncbi:hypothetical protein BHE74_00031679 [Ensete ventricosum]|nr:hypothetical protein GW17_00024987 [Ensete ventricosum]RWW61266.1 hypothetical protein BHE74_00031679 [Ensete ventricosum]RZS02345.1 hypothetical protein BHM03_00032389 [Ensete ventricosum]